MMENQEMVLKKFYQKLYDNLEKNKKKMKENSVIISFLDLKSNDRYRLLSESSIFSYKIPKEILSELQNKKLIRNTDTLNSYTITAKGIWDIENKNNFISELILLDYLDQKFFNVYNVSEKPLTDKQKVIIFSMLAARTFSEKSSVDLKKDETVMNTWKEIVDKSYEKLKSLNLISELDQKDLYGKSGNEHPVSNLYRHTDELPKKTRGLFKALGNQKYFLDLLQNNEISKETLSFLFKQIFNNKVLSTSEINEIDSFCREIAFTKNIYLFDPRDHIFSKPEYDEIIRETLLFS